MATIALPIAKELFEDQVIREVKKKLKKIFTRRLVTALGKRAAGALGALLVPEPIVSKIMAIGFGIWGVWTALEIIYEFITLSELFEETLQKIWETVLLPVITSSKPPDEDRLTRILRCMMRVWVDALTEVSIGEQLLGKSLNQIKTDAFDKMVDCTQIP